MRLDLSEILHRVGMRYAYAVSEPPIVDDSVVCVRGVEGEIVFTNTGSALLLEGRVETAVSLQCSRCLTTFEQSVAALVQEQFGIEHVGSGPRGRPAHVAISDDAGAGTAELFAGALFDLTEMLRQALALELPAQPLHAVDCAGLCPHCGADLNIGPCGCARDEGHHALAGLRALLGNTDD